MKLGRHAVISGQHGHERNIVTPASYHSVARASTAG